MYTEVGENMSSSHLPCSKIVAVPAGVDVDAAHVQVLLRAFVSVDVVISNNDTQSQGTVDVQEDFNCFTCTYPIGQLV